MTVAITVGLLMFGAVYLFSKRELLRVMGPDVRHSDDEKRSRPQQNTPHCQKGPFSRSQAAHRKPHSGDDQRCRKTDSSGYDDGRRPVTQCPREAADNTGLVSKIGGHLGRVRAVEQH